MAEAPLTIERQSGQLLVAGGDGLETIDAGEWSATKLDSGRILLTSKESGATPANSEGFAKCSIDVLHDMLVGLNHRRWTGMILVDTGYGQKKLHFNRGNLTFAGSTLIDDRLGEVIYREEMISLDQLTDSAVQVDRATKFGQVLLRDKIFSNTDLWAALKSQVREIFRSTFLVSEVYFEIQKGNPPTEVTFDEGTASLIESAYCAGLQFRCFYRRLRNDATVAVIEGERVAKLVPGTFLADMVQLVHTHESVKELIAVSKLTDVNTLWVLHRMSCLGYLTFSGLSEAKAFATDGSFANLKSKLDSFILLSDLVIKTFAKSQIPYPISELQKFAWTLNDGNLSALYIDNNGRLGVDCIGNIMSQCMGTQDRLGYFEVRVDSLVRYVLQLVSDLLPNTVSKQLKAEYAEYSA